MFKKYFTKFAKISAVFFFIAVLGFSNLAPAIFNFVGQNQLAESFKIKEAHAATLQYVGGAEASGASADYNVSLTALTGGIGSAAQAGDLVIVATGFGSSANLNPGVSTAGYTEVADTWGNDTIDANFSANWKIMGGTPDSLVTCLGSTSASYASVCVVHVWRGADQTTPMDVAVTSVSGTNSSLPNSPAITPVTSGAIVISAGLGTDAAADATVTAPTGYGNQVDISFDSTNAATVGISSKAWSGSGAEDPAAWTNFTTGTADAWGAATLAIRPANDPPTITVSQPDGTGDTVTVGDLYNITYDLSDAEEVVTAAMYYDTDAVGLNGTAITGACATAAEGAGATCSWNTTGMTPGSYYVYASTTDGVNPVVNDYSPGQITINAPAAVLTVGTSGSQIANADSGATAVALDGAFTFITNTGSDSVTSIKVTNNGDAGNLSNVNLYYDTSGNGVGGGDDTLFGTGALGSAISGSMAISTTMKYVYVVADIPNTVAGGKTVDLQISNPSTDVATGATNTDTVAKNITNSTTIRPNITSITYPITSPLNGSRIGQSITINGAGFGTTCDGTNNRITIGGAGNVVSCTDTTFSNTSISITNFQYSSGDSYGGTASLLARVGGTDDDASQDIYVYPDITDVTNPTAYTNAAREYNASDSDGVITINGNHFGTAQGSGSVTVLGQTANIVSWGATAIQIQIPTSIADNSYTGNIISYQGTGGNSTASDTYGSGIYRILPRITSFIPTNPAKGESVQIVGNHLCQAGAASCPTGFDANNKITFYNGVDATYFDSWNNTSATTTVPATAQSGNVILKSNNYDSNALNLTLGTNAPYPPSSLNQFKSDGSTQITTNSGTNESSVKLAGGLSATSSMTMVLEVEVKPINSPFDGISTTTSTPNCVGSSCSNQQALVSSLSSGTQYHWRARAKNVISGDASTWVSFGGNSDGDPPTTAADRDFYSDTTAPVISGIGTPPGCTAHSNVSDVSASINWTASDNFNSSITNEIRYGTDSSLVTYSTSSATAGTNPSATLNGLSASTAYYYQVFSTDAVLNASSSPASVPFCTFNTTSPQTRLMKTLEFYVGQSTSTGNNLTANFDAFISESNTAGSNIYIKGAFMEIFGISKVDSGNVTIDVNFQSGLTPSGTVNYIVNPGGTSPTYWTLTRQITNLDWDRPGDNNHSNTVSITVSGNNPITSLLGAKVYVTYYYEPQ